MPSFAHLAGSFLAGTTAGLVGTPHCAAMCGPLGYAACGGRGSQAMATYLAGRASTYVGFGAIAGGVGQAAQHLLAGLGVGSLVSFAVAGILVWMAWPMLKPEARSQWVQLRTRPRSERGMAPLWLGLGTGLLPCGLLWTTLSAAAATGAILSGAAFMLGFALASSPALGLWAWLVRAVPAELASFRRVVGATLLVGALVFTARGLAPWLQDEPAACHSEAS